jgi:hypothetical protein
MFVSKSTVFWAAKLCTLVDVHQFFRGTYRLNLQGQREAQETSKKKAMCSPVKIHGITCQKTALFIITTVIT